MADPHIYLTQDIKDRVKEYANNNGLNFSQAVRNLIDVGLNTSEENFLLKQNSALLEKIFSRQLYLRDLIEQFYSDMEIEKLSNPRNNKALQKFKTNKDKLKYDE